MIYCRLKCVNPFSTCICLAFILIFIILNNCAASIKDNSTDHKKKPFEFNVLIDKDLKIVSLSFKNISKTPLKLRLKSFAHPMFDLRWRYTDKDGQVILGGNGQGASGLGEIIRSGSVATLLPEDVFEYKYDISQRLKGFKDSKMELLSHQTNVSLSLSISFLDLIVSPFEADDPRKGFSFVYVPSIKIGDPFEIWPELFKKADSLRQ